MVGLFYEWVFWLGLVLLAAAFLYPEWFVVILLLVLSLMLVVVVLEGFKIGKRKNVKDLLKENRHRLVHMAVLALVVAFAVIRNGWTNIRSQFSNFILAPLGLTWWLFSLIGFVSGLALLNLLLFLDKRRINLSRIDHERLERLMQMKGYKKIGLKKRKPRILLPKLHLPEFSIFVKKIVSLLKYVKRPTLGKKRVKKMKDLVFRTALLLKHLRLRFTKKKKRQRILLSKLHLPKLPISVKKIMPLLKYARRLALKKKKIKKRKAMVFRAALFFKHLRLRFTARTLKVLTLISVAVALAAAYIFYNRYVLRYAFFLAGVAIGFAILFLYGMLKDIKAKKVVKYKIPEVRLKYGTDLDRLYQLIKLKGTIRISEVVASFNVKKEVAEEWGKILESHGMIEVKYSAVGELILCRK